jgi:hypothetical protein
MKDKWSSLVLAEPAFVLSSVAKNIQITRVLDESEGLQCAPRQPCFPALVSCFRVAKGESTTHIEKSCHGTIHTTTVLPVGSYEYKRRSFERVSNHPPLFKWSRENPRGFSFSSHRERYLWDCCQPPCLRRVLTTDPKQSTLPIHVCYCLCVQCITCCTYSLNLFILREAKPACLLFVITAFCVLV